MSVAATRVVLRLEPAAPATPEPDRVVAVLDTTWVAAPAPAAPMASKTDPGGVPISLRDIGERVLAKRDLIEQTADLLDGWVEQSGVIDAMAMDGTSYWYYVRLRHWMWLQQEVLWLGVLDELLHETRPGAIECAAGADEAIVRAAERIGTRDGVPVTVEAGEPTAGTMASTPAPGPARGPLPPTLRQRIDRARLRLIGRLGQQDPKVRRAVIKRRMERLATVPGRLLVVHEHARQRVETPTGPVFMNPYLGPIVERLRGTRLAPIELDIKAKVGDDATWLRVNEWGSDRLLSADAIWLAGAPWPKDDVDEMVEERARRIDAMAVPVVVSGVDLGPALAARVAAEVRRSLADQFRGAVRVRRLLQRLRPAGILLADEYHRQAWLAAARAEGIPTAAVQHGIIYRRHNGYVHRARPAALTLADRTYLFGRWERDLLVERSVYRDDEVRVGGSPRLDLARPEAVDRQAIRDELAIVDGERMVVISGTWGPLYRRFHYPIALARLVDRPLPNVHFVVKLHPGETDEGPYRAVIERSAAAGGFAPPPVTVVQSIDLYRLLAAADAHLGVHSTVLTEAVATGTPNLLFEGLAGGDLLGYVKAGVAHPVRNGGDVLEALDQGRAAGSDAARSAFLASHFEPGSASERIADDLLAWL